MQKQPLQMFNKNSVLKNCGKIYRKTSALKSLYNIDKTGNFIKKGVQNMCFPLNFTKFLTISFLKNTPRHYFCVGCIFKKYFAFEGLFRLIEPLLLTLKYSIEIFKNVQSNVNIQSIQIFKISTQYKTLKVYKHAKLQTFKNSNIQKCTIQCQK